MKNAFGIPISESICPDCDAEVKFVEMAPGVTVLQVMHDDTCPRLAAMERGGDRS